jgi:hypothetical protein
MRALDRQSVERSELARGIDARAHPTGEFTFRSGLVGHEYFDKYLFESDPQLLREVAVAELRGALGITDEQILAVGTATNSCGPGPDHPRDPRRAQLRSRYAPRPPLRSRRHAGRRGAGGHGGI